MNRLQMTILLLSLVLGTLATTVLTRYPGLINLGVEFKGGRGYVVIDGRTIDRPALPPTK